MPEGAGVVAATKLVEMAWDLGRAENGDPHGSFAVTALAMALGLAVARQAKQHGASYVTPATQASLEASTALASKTLRIMMEVPADG